VRFVGRLTDWNDAKGYGFVEPHGGGERAFVHIRAFGRSAKRPANGALISYSVERDAQRRVTAVDVCFMGARARPQATSQASLPRTKIALGFGLLLAAGWWFAKLPLAVIGLYVAMSIVAFAMYRADKSAAEAGRWRTPESTLHFVDVLGGWPGGLVAQDVFRHKSRKGSFQATFWLSVVLNLVVVAWLVKNASA
jgi:uncharacterized membrane protein YsdA (DUF1294 family)/cold shock CspA family protein